MCTSFSFKSLKLNDWRIEYKLSFIKKQHSTSRSLAHCKDHGQFMIRRAHWNSYRSEKWHFHHRGTHSQKTLAGITLSARRASWRDNEHNCINSMCDVSRTQKVQMCQGICWSIEQKSLAVGLQKCSWRRMSILWLSVNHLFMIVKCKAGIVFTQKYLVWTRKQASRINITTRAITDVKQITQSICLTVFHQYHYTN